MYCAKRLTYSLPFAHVLDDPTTIAKAAAVVATHRGTESSDMCVVQFLATECLVGKAQDMGGRVAVDMCHPSAGYDSVVGTTTQAGGSRIHAFHRQSRVRVTRIVTLALPMHEGWSSSME